MYKTTITIINNYFPVCAVNCRYLQVDNSAEFTCQTVGGSGQIFSISYAINNAPPDDGECLYVKS